MGGQREKEENRLLTQSIRAPLLPSTAYTWSTSFTRSTSQPVSTSQPYLHHDLALARGVDTFFAK